MRRAALIFNPRSGRQRALAAIAPAIVLALAEYGISAYVLETTGPGTAGALALTAANAGAEIVFACGGDGTVHEVLQGLVGTTSALGIIPIGTANALARNLGISGDPVEAAVQQATAKAIRIAVGEVTYLGSSNASIELQRYFVVMAGAGPDGALVYSLLTSRKSVMGRTAYYVHAARLFFARPFQPFRVAYRRANSLVWEERIAVSMMSARIGDLGGIFGRLTRGSSMHSSSLRLLLVRPPARIALPAWFVLGSSVSDTSTPGCRRWTSASSDANLSAPQT